MVKFYFTDWDGKKHTKTAKKAEACTYSYEEDKVLVVRDYFTGAVVSKLNIPDGWRMTYAERS